MKNILSFFLLFCASCSALAKNRNILTDSVKKYSKAYIIEIPNEPRVITKHLILDPDKIVTLDNLSEQARRELDTLLNVEKILIIRFEVGTKLLNLNDVLKKYNIESKYWTIPVFVNGVEIDYPGTILIAENQIERIEVKHNSDGQFIAIDTR